MIILCSIISAITTHATRLTHTGHKKWHLVEDFEMLRLMPDFETLCLICDFKILCQTPSRRNISKSENCAWQKILECSAWRLILKHCVWRVISKHCARCPPDTTFQNIVSDDRQTSARCNISKSGVRRKISKLCVRHYNYSVTMRQTCSTSLAM